MTCSAILFVLFTSNNLICSLTDLNGNVLFWTSGGSNKSKGLKKLVPLVISACLCKIGLVAKRKGFERIHIKLKGLTKNKKLVLKSINLIGLDVNSIQDVTALPHNGCRIKRQKRL